MEPSPFSNASKQHTESPSETSSERHVLTLERLLGRVSEGRRPSLKAHDLQKLNQIDLDGEKLSAIPLEVVAKIPSVTRLFLQNNSLTDLTVLSKLHHLRYLNLANNKITKLSGLKNMTSLVGLNLTNNQIQKIDLTELPRSLQFLQLRHNPVAAKQSSEALIAELAQKLPNLRQVDGFGIKDGQQVEGPFLDASSGESDVTANALIDGAMQDIAEEDFTRAQSALRALNIEPSFLTKDKSFDILDKLEREFVKDVASPIRLTPTVSRQVSQDLTEMSSTTAANNSFVARVREALPTVREATDIGLRKKATDVPRHTQSADPNFLPQRSISLSETSTGGGLQPASSEPRQTFRTLTMPPHMERKFSSAHRASTGLRDRQENPSAPIFPLVHAPPDFKLYPTEFQNTLSSAISMLVGSTALPRQAFTEAQDSRTIWEQSQIHRQKVLDYLFSKRPAEEIEKPASSHFSRRNSMARMNSTVGGPGLRRGRAGSVISEEMLQGLHRRDPPRAEGLSAAIQGPPTDPPGIQLASLSEDSQEKAAAERVRTHLRRSLVKTLDNAQKRRELEPAAEAPVVAELQKLKETRTMRNLVALRQGQMPSQPKVLATILESHSRLGSITDRLEKVLPRTASYGMDIDATPLSNISIPHNQSNLASPFAKPKSSDGTASADSEDSGQPRRRPLDSRHSSQLGSAPSSRPEPRSLSPITAKQKNRRPIPEPGSPGSDQDPDPPKTRQDARPIFGGIAKMIRGPSGLQALVEAKAVESSSRPNSLGSRPTSSARPSQPGLSRTPQEHSPARPSTLTTQLPTDREEPVVRPPLDKTAMLRSSPGTQSQRTMSTAATISRSGSSYLSVLQTHHDLETIQNAAAEAERKKAEFQKELWQRMFPENGPSPVQASPHPRPEGSSILPSPFSPFSKNANPQKSPQANSSITPRAGPHVAPSPFSQAGQEPSPSYDSSFVRSPARTTDEELSPFAYSTLPALTKPPPLPGSASEEPAYSAPVLATQNILTGNLDAIPNASSTPPSNTLREAIQGAVKAHRSSNDSKNKDQEEEGCEPGKGLQPSPFSEGSRRPQSETKPTAKTYKSPFSL